MYVKQEGLYWQRIYISQASQNSYYSSIIFDPLAILLVIAANISIEKYMPKSQPEYKKAKRALNEIENKIKTKTTRIGTNVKRFRKFIKRIK